MLFWSGIDRSMKMRETSRAIDKKLWVNNRKIAAAGLGAVTLIVGFFYNAFG